MPKTELVFTDEEIDRFAERIAYKIAKPDTENLSYGTIARYKKCTVYFDCDENANDMFIIRDKNNNIIGEFVETDTIKHGKWFLLDECSNEGVYCSVCGKKVYKTGYANQKIKSKYCPNCGAIMDLDGE